MRFHADGPTIPDTLLESCDAGRVVFLCGAGVSKPSGMPDFVGLTKHVIEFFDPPAGSEIMTAFRPWLDGRSAGNVPLDQIFNLLHLEYGKDEVNALVTERLRAPLEVENCGREHGLIKRVSSSLSGEPQIVTTNFDRLFEEGREGEIDVHVPPAFTDLNFGSTIKGITYLHGRLVDVTSESHSYVLSSADFGRAYLSEGWATNFIKHLLEQYTVVLVGYQAEDPPIKYLLQGLNHDGQYDRSRLYAFDQGLPEEIEAKWRDRGVTAIAYADHSDLWKSMEAWASRADDPRHWRKSIVAKSQQDPKSLTSHERGQVAHVLRTVQGARLFSEADPLPHPEWVCVMDANVRSAKQVSGYGDDAELFDPGTAYGIDDDLRGVYEDDRMQGFGNDHIYVWRAEDDNPNDFHRLSGLQPYGFEVLPKRLGHLIAWFGKSINSPVLAWWVIRQSRLHPRLLQQIEWQVERSTSLQKRARHIWSLILESRRDPRDNQWDGDWFDLKRRVNAESWTASFLRDFQRVVSPRLEIGIPFGLAKVRPPSGSWEEVNLSDLGEFKVVLLDRHNEILDIPDDILPQVFGFLERQLIVASGLLGDIDAIYFKSPTCYPDREVEGEVIARESVDFVIWFIQIFDRMAAKWPVLASAHATTWSVKDPFFFRKLKLYAWSKKDLFEAAYIADEVLSLDQETFWDTDVVRELLFLLVDRWRELSQESRNKLIDRILEGPDQRANWSDEALVRRDEFATRYARYLELQGCELAADRSEQLAEMVRSIPEWSDGWATAMVMERGSFGGWVGTDEAPDAILNLPVNEIVSKAKEDLTRDPGCLTEKRSFTGLVKANPRKALSALTISGKSGDYPQAFWSSLIDDLPSDVTPRLRRVFLNRLKRLPDAVIVKLRHTMGRWIKESLVDVLSFDNYLGWEVYDHIVGSILRGGPAATKSSLGEVRHGGNVIQRSRRTFGHAINSPIGNCARALFQAIPGETQEAGSLIPGHIKIRVERLFMAPGEGSDHVVSIVGMQLNWLTFVDPTWVEEHIIPMLKLEHPASEAAWNGFLHSNQEPQPLLAKLIKPLLLDLFPWIEGISWSRELPTAAAQFIGLLRIFYSDEPGGFSRGEIRSVIRAMSDNTRNGFISWLSQVGRQNESGWIKYVIPLIKEDWPREHRYRTSTSMGAWIALLDDTGDSFPTVYEAVKRFLIPVETRDQLFYRFTGEIDGERPIAVKFPETTLDLMNRATPRVLAHPPYILPKVLALIVEVEPRLTSDPRYLRLIDLVEKS